MKIGIFGGSFNPVHEGHLRLADAALSELNLKKIYFVPTYQTPLKNKELLLPIALRVKLLKAALRGKPFFSVSLCEIQRKSTSFTVDTLQFFRRTLGPRAILYFLCGADVLRNLRRWKSWRRVLKLCRFVVMTRPGYPMQNVPKGVLVLPFEALDLSSSSIRKKMVLPKVVKNKRRAFR